MEIKYFLDDDVKKQIRLFKKNNKKTIDSFKKQGVGLEIAILLRMSKNGTKDVFDQEKNFMSLSIKFGDVDSKVFVQDNFNAINDLSRAFNSRMSTIGIKPSEFGVNPFTYFNYRF